MQLSLAMAAVAFFSFLGFYKTSNRMMNAMAFFTAAGCSAMVFTQFFDHYDNNFALGVSLMFLLWTFTCIAFGIIGLFPGREE